MTRKKAIEAAVSAGWEAYESEQGDSMLHGMDAMAETSAGWAYDLGKIAGLKAAIAMRSSRSWRNSSPTRVS